ncbi:MAG: hypothetical protein R2703_01725 [Micropruina glycogenica]
MARLAPVSSAAASTQQPGKRSGVGTQPRQREGLLIGDRHGRDAESLDDAQCLGLASDRRTHQALGQGERMQCNSSRRWSA